MKTKIKPSVKKFTKFTPRIFSRHPSHDALRGVLPKMPFRSIVRLGSTTQKDDGKIRVFCNTPEAVKNSASKLLMKQCFTNANITTAPWMPLSDINGYDKNQEGKDTLLGKNNQVLLFPLIVKHIFGSRGTGNSKVDTPEQMDKCLVGKLKGHYIVEQYKSFTREYRLHVTKNGCFYTCRKMLKKDTPEEKKFQRHDDNCVWILEENPSFDKPTNWNNIVEDCVKALISLGLDIGAFDLKVQSAKDSKGNIRQSPEWIVIESCSAPSFGEITTKKYIEEIPKILFSKAKEQGLIV